MTSKLFGVCGGEFCSDTLRCFYPLFFLWCKSVEQGEQSKYDTFSYNMAVTLLFLAAR
jgi:hypothetical protein